MRICFKRLDYALLIISSILLGVWAANNTIALRNILLGIGSLFGLYYLYRELLLSDSKSRIRLVDLLPIICIVGMFVWVLLHFYFISSGSDLQWREIKSTWMRSFLAVLLGVSTGMAMHNIRRMIPWLWFGAMLSFLYLMIQYVPRALELQSIFAIDWSGYYIFRGKINCVLIGSVLVAGLVGTWIDEFRWDRYHHKAWISLYCALGIILVLYAYVFLFDTRNGLGVAIILITSWVIFTILWSLKRICSGASIKISKTLLVPIVLVVCGTIWLGSQQIQRNSGWSTMIEDAYIASQVDKYPNWQNVAKFGIPKTAEGRVVAGNTYERVSWAMIGLQLVPKQPWGNGVLAGAFGDALKKSYPDAKPMSTHSAWIEITLAYGLPGIILTASPLILILLLTLMSPAGFFDASIYSLTFVLLILYSIGELSTQHGIEILFYVTALLAALRLPINGCPTIFKHSN